MAARKIDIYENLRRRIITNNLRPGEKISEKELMAEYELGRTPLREILLKLEDEGLIQKIGRLATIVSVVDYQKISEIIEMRRELDLLVAKLAVERITEEQISVLKAVFLSIDNIDAVKEGAIESMAQQAATVLDKILEATRNSELRKTINRFHVAMSRVWHHMGFSNQDFLDDLNDLRMAVDALELRDPTKTGEALLRRVDRFVKRVKDTIL